MRGLQTRIFDSEFFRCLFAKIRHIGSVKIFGERKKKMQKFEEVAVIRGIKDGKELENNK